MDNWLVFFFGLLIGIFGMCLGVLLYKQEGLENRVKFLEDELDETLDDLTEAGVWKKEDVG